MKVFSVKLYRLIRDCKAQLSVRLDYLMTSASFLSLSETKHPVSSMVNTDTHLIFCKKDKFRHQN